MEPIVTEVAPDVQRRERRLRIFRGAATLCYMIFAGSGMLLLASILFSSVGPHNSLLFDVIEVAPDYSRWPLFYRAFVPLGITVSLIDLRLRCRRAYRYL